MSLLARCPISQSAYPFSFQLLPSAMIRVLSLADAEDELDASKLAGRLKGLWALLALYLQAAAFNKSSHVRLYPLLRRPTQTSPPRPSSPSSPPTPPTPPRLRGARPPARTRDALLDETCERRLERTGSRACSSSPPSACPFAHYSHLVAATTAAGAAAGEGQHTRSRRTSRADVV
ncbi:hypothetical protein B0H17DRAFT_1219786 [Mycena rosella]|uniref:Uncharacterized protein n=1 Tax=Mycena rosella TaxID=1033263 RepID=A0AAD7BF19_MYCRO|nr:hypothetical protein B0H17DRAFT_1219786 [Mycena rosella]